MTTTPSGKNGKSLFDAIGKPGVNKDTMLAKMVRIPEGYTHMGLANVDGQGMSVVVAHEDWFNPLVYDFRTRQWVQMLRKSDGGVLHT